MAKHYLTFEGLTSCTVNGQAVESGYELKDGDVIVANVQGNPSSITCNGERYGLPGDSIDISNSDINLIGESGGGAQD